MQSKLSSNKQLLHSLAFEAIGTHWRIETESPLSADTIKHVFAGIADFDKKWSRFRADSTVTACNQAADTIPLDSDEYEMFLLYKKLYELSGGAITPLTGQTIVDMGYDSTYSLQPSASIRHSPNWEDVLELRPSSLLVKQPALLDIGAAGKGLLVDRISAIVEEKHGSFVVDAGGDIYVGGRTEHVGLEQPDDISKMIGVANTQNQALCGSASNRRAWSKYHHIIDARGSTPVESIVASWAMHTNTMHADMAATALFFIEPLRLLPLIDVTYVVVYHDGSVRYAKDKEIQLYV